MITVAIGDIHGMYDMLDRLLVGINALAIRERGIGRPKLVFLGDYVDRGPDARRVVRRVRALQGDFAVCLRGNHEEMMVRCEDRPIDWQNFVLNGGAQTLASYQGAERVSTFPRRISQICGAWAHAHASAPAIT
jgi:serine/threonine protein phosphatase 1